MIYILNIILYIIFILLIDFYIKAPFAVLRVSGGKTAPRYISYSTLGKCIEDIKAHIF